MAEINVQRRSSTILWVVIGLGILALILWLIFGWGTGADISMAPDGSTPIASLVTSGLMT